jgi:hypothetical protein
MSRVYREYGPKGAAGDITSDITLAPGQPGIRTAKYAREAGCPDNALVRWRNLYVEQLSARSTSHAKWQRLPRSAAVAAARKTAVAAADKKK